VTQHAETREERRRESVGVVAAGREKQTVTPYAEDLGVSEFAGVGSVSHLADTEST
jgi:hypothetical protein